MKTFSFYTDNVAIYTTLMPLMRSFGYNVFFLEDIPMEYIRRGVTIVARSDGQVFIAYFKIEPVRELVMTRLDQLTMFLRTDTFYSLTAAEEAAINLENSLSTSFYQALLAAVPQLKEFIETVKEKERS